MAGSVSGSQSTTHSATAAGGLAGVDELIGKLNLQEREEDDLNFDEEFPDEVDEAEFMAIARVHTNKPFSRGAFYDSMRLAWSLAQGATFNALGGNLFVITVNCLGDWKRVTEEGPWLFRDHGVLIERYDGFTKPNDVIFDSISVWIQIVDLPPLYRKDAVIRSLTRKVGKLESVMLNPRWGDGRIVRVRVKLDVNEPLMRFVSITKNQKKVYYSILYEKIPVFCYVCGHMGHTHLEHGNGKHTPESMDWGDWMLAPRPGTQGQQGQGRSNFGQRGRRTGARGRGDDGTGDDPKDDDNSHTRDTKAEIVDKHSSRKRLNYELVVTEPKLNQLVIKEPVVHGTDGSVTDMEVHKDPALAGVDEEDDENSSQDAKRSKNGTTAVMDASHLISASSVPELDRLQ